MSEDMGEEGKKWRERVSLGASVSCAAITDHGVLESERRHFVENDFYCFVWEGRLLRCVKGRSYKRYPAATMSIINVVS